MRIKDVHEDFKSIKLLKTPPAASVLVENFWSSSFDVFASEQLMHGRAGRVHGIKDNQVACAIVVTLKPNNSERVAGLLEVDRWQ